MSTVFPLLNALTPIEIWGFLPRIMGVLYFIAIAPLYWQMLPLGGSQGIKPAKLQLAKIAKGYPTWKRFTYFPTLLWLNSEDWFMQGLVVVGSLSALLAIYGGAFTGWALLICWVVFLSLDLPVGLPYPWDSLLLEAGFLALFLPPISSLPHISAVNAPYPLLVFAFQFLVFRVLFGFGKFKFGELHLKERLYLKQFVINQPLPTPLGWYAHRLPNWVSIAAHVFMFIAEMILPFFIFLGGDFRIIGALGIAALMVGIQLSGNFGYFNVAVIGLCVGLLDTHSSIFNQSVSEIFSSPSSIITHAVLVVLLFGGLINLPFNSWCARSWLYWPAFLQVPSKWVQRLLAFYRSFLGFRVLHSYGVFPPQSSPPLKWIARIEGSNDGVEWKSYEYRFAPTQTTSAPKFIAPYHPRFDHSIFYEVFGTNLSNFLEPVFSHGNPYIFSHTSTLEGLVQHLLAGNKSVVRLLGSNPFPDVPPKMIRVNTYMLEPTTPEELRRTGNWWHLSYAGVHLPVATLDTQVLADMYTDPELFNWDEIIWIERSPRLKQLMTQATSGQKPEAVIGVSAQDLDQFWHDFIPFLHKADSTNWQHMPQFIQQLRQRYDKDRLRCFETIFARLNLIFYARLKPHFMDQKQPKLDIPTFFHFGLLGYYIIAKGQQTYEMALNDPVCTASLAKEMLPEAGFFYMAIFWYDTLLFQARKLRMLEQHNKMDWEPAISGFVQLVPFLKTQFVGVVDEAVPEFARLIQNGDWMIVDESQPSGIRAM